MTFSPISLLRAPGLATLGLALLALGAPGLARADEVKLHYGVTLIGLPIGSAAVTGTVEPNSYKLEASAKVAGLASILSTSHGAAVSTGSLAGGKPSPATFATTSVNSSMTRTIRIAMRQGDVTGLDISPPWDPNIKRVPFGPGDTRGIIDPLSAFLMSVPPGTDPVSPAACERTLPMFDGGVRFDVRLSFVGKRHVKIAGYDGDVAVCSARYIPISGQRENSRSSQFMADNKELETWLAPVAGSRSLLPVRISVRTMIGTVVIDADEFRVDGVTHASLR